MPLLFIPWVRYGLNAMESSYKALETDKAGKVTEVTTSRRNIRVTTRIVDQSGVRVSESVKSFTLMGPGEVVGFSQDAVAMTEPLDGEGEFSVNQMPYIEFTDADFPWRYSIAEPQKGTAADSQKDQLTPWLALIALKQDEFSDLPPSECARIISVNSKLLPDLSQIWSCAHIQVSSPDDINRVDVADYMRKNPGNACSRIICMRKLEPSRQYSAFLVPVYNMGYMAALGFDVNENSDYSWDYSIDRDMALPYYYRFDFSTSEFGDFRELAKRIEVRGGSLPHSRTVYDTEGRALQFEGIVKPIASLEPERQHNITFTAGKIDEFRRICDGLNVTDENAEPELNMPLYGYNYADKKVLSPPDNNGAWDHLSNTAGAWFSEANFDRGFRYAASLGAELIRDNQDKFVSRCFAMGGDIIPANSYVNQFKTISQVRRSIIDRHVNPRSDIKFLLATKHLQKFYEGYKGADNSQGGFPFAWDYESCKKRQAELFEEFRKCLREMGPVVSRGIENKAETLIGSQISGKTDRVPISQIIARALEKGEIEIDSLSRERIRGTAAGQISAEAIREEAGKAGIRIDGPVSQRIRDAVVNEIGSQIFKEPASKAGAEFEGQVSRTIRDVLSKQTGLRPIERQNLEKGINQLIELAADQVIKQTFEKHINELEALEKEDLEKEALERDILVKQVRERQAVQTATEIRTVGTAIAKLQASEPDVMYRDFVQPVLQVQNESLRVYMLNLMVTGLMAAPAVQSIANAGSEATGADSDKTYYMKACAEEQVGRGLVNTIGHKLGVGADAGFFISHEDSAKVGLSAIAAAANWYRNAFVTIDMPKKRLEGMVIPNEALSGSKTPGDSYFYFAPKINDGLFDYIGEDQIGCLFPGLTDMNNNSIAMLLVNQKFLEAYMLGANMEMVQELVWREFPVYRQATVFHNFWEPNDAGSTDITDIKSWKKLGGNHIGMFADNIIVAIRADLFRRYPRTIPFIVEHNPDIDYNTLIDVLLKKNNLNVPEGAIRIYEPKFSADLFSDLSLQYYELTAGHMQAMIRGGVKKFSFAMLENFTIPKFGLSETTGTASWSYYGTNAASGYLNVTDGKFPDNSAAAADALLSRPCAAVLDFGKIVTGI